MFAEERRAKLLELLSQEGPLEVGVLSSKLGVSPMTIRRDLAVLDAQGLIKRARGGALPSANSLAREIPYRTKKMVAVEEKRRIGRVAAGLIGDNETVILDSGSTTLMVAENIPKHVRGLTVVTNDVRIAVRLAERSGVSLVVTGGTIQDSVFTLVGSHAERLLRSLRVDMAIMGVDAIDYEGTIYNRSIDEVSIKRAMIEAADRVVVVAHSAKFHQRAFVRVATLDDIDVIVTDSAPPSSLSPLLRESGVQVIIAENVDEVKL